MFRRLIRGLLALSVALSLTVIGAAAHASPPRPATPADWSPQPSQGTPFVANYAGTLREATPRADGIQHIDTPRMIKRLKALHVTTYWFLVWYTPTEWQDFVNEFEPAAEKAGINVYLYLVGPSECTPVCSAPYNTDFVAWGHAIGALSRQHSNIKGWAIDDFIYNTTLFTPAYVKSFVDASHAENPAIRFYSQVYQNNLTDQFVKDYTPVVDGYVLAFRDDPWHNTQVTGSLSGQLDADVAMVRQYGKSLVLMTYASNLSNTAMPPPASYVDTVTRTGLDYLRAGKIDGLVQYVLRMDDAQEPAASYDHARTGNGALSLVDYLSDENGGYAQASQPVTVDPAATGHSLQFWVRDQFGGNLTSGVQRLQVLVDGAVAWQTDAAAIQKGAYVAENVDLGPQLAGRKDATITLRLATITSAHSFYTGLVVDDLTATGFTVRNAGFEKRADWTLARTSPAYLPDYDIFDPDRAISAFADVQAQYGPHALVIRAAALPNRTLLRTAQLVLREFLAGHRPAAGGLAQALAAQARTAGQPILAEQASLVAHDLT
ncbi:MAG TPA: hypothetical protein VHX59_16540 [Mycobacteriales bacterium]|jgi:hypothetical protein|nr:hypothetical protein [Mycobacteriales bacterium]